MCIVRIWYSILTTEKRAKGRVMPRKATERGERKFAKQPVGPYWKPGQPHPLDILDQELAEVHAQVPEVLEALRATAHATQQRLEALLTGELAGMDISAPFSTTEHTANRLIVDRFHNRKHLHHLVTLFAVQRHKRFLGRLHTIQAALDLVNGLLETEETLAQEVLSAWTTAEQHATQQTNQDEPRPAPTREQQRTQGLADPLAPLLSSVEHARRRLAEFEGSLPALRQQLASGQGWFEVFFVPKRRYKAEVLAYAQALKAFQKTGRPIPSALVQALHPEVAQILLAGGTTFPRHLRLQVYDILPVGPYAKYRWIDHKHTYTIALGLLDDYPPYPFVPEGF